MEFAAPGDHSEREEKGITVKGKKRGAEWKGRKAKKKKKLDKCLDLAREPEKL